MESKHIASFLRAAKERIEDPNDWCQGFLAVNNDGGEVPPNSKNAVRWCATGSLNVPAFDWGGFDILEAVARQMLAERGVENTDTDLCNAAFLNDTFGHAAVMELYGRAIACAEQEGDDALHPYP